MPFAQFDKVGRSASSNGADDGRVELVPNEVLPETAPPHSSNFAGSVPVLYYTTAGGRIGEETAIVTNSVGGQFIVSPSGRPSDIDPKQRPVTEQLVARLMCLSILALLVAPLMGLFVVWAFLRCRRAFRAANAASDRGADAGGLRAEAALWARRTEKLFVAAMFVILAELVIVLLAVEYHMRLSGTFPDGN